MAEIALALGIVLTALTIVEKILVIKNQIKKPKTKRQPRKRKRK
ncbi:hypothetical protein [Bacillus sp. REN10]|nr:hypothetical protein [Bacillus sp. REN10]